MSRHCARMGAYPETGRAATAPTLRSSMRHSNTCRVVSLQRHVFKSHLPQEENRTYVHLRVLKAQCCHEAGPGGHRESPQACGRNSFLARLENRLTPSGQPTRPVRMGSLPRTRRQDHHARGEGRNPDGYNRPGRQLKSQVSGRQEGLLSAYVEAVWGIGGDT